MRDIKFRAWVNQDLDPFMAKIETLYFKDNEICLGGYMEALDQVTLMQYTGLKDKNGVEIYEGDIVKSLADYKHPDERVMKAGNYKIEYRMSGFGIFRMVGWWDLSDWAVTVAPEYGVIRYIEVIGNIYENPELTK